MASRINAELRRQIGPHFMDNLQVTPSDSERLPRQAAPLHASQDTRTILLAEDDSALRLVMTVNLSSLGYRVFACPDAQAAASEFRTQPHVDLLLTDFQMPGATGVDLARELTGLRPSLPVVIITGSTLTRQTMQEIEERQWTFVPKPCHLRSLEGILKRVTGEHRPVSPTFNEAA